MKKLGTIKAYDERGKAHLFEAFHTPQSYYIYLDGAFVRKTKSHWTAIQAIAAEADKRGYRGRSCA